MKRIQVAYGGRSRIFGVPSGAPDEALLALVRLEFALPADASLALELHFADGTFTLLPFVGTQCCALGSACLHAFVLCVVCVCACLCVHKR